MKHLNFEEYTEMSDVIKNEEEFEKYVLKAEVVIDNVTQHYYQYHDFDEDRITWRKENFKQAIAAQVDFFHSYQTTDFNEISSVPQAFSIGRTSITNSDARRSDDGSNHNSIVANDVYLYLEGTGLLYRGGAL